MAPCRDSAAGKGPLILPPVLAKIFPSAGFSVCQTYQIGSSSFCIKKADGWTVSLYVTRTPSICTESTQLENSQHFLALRGAAKHGKVNQHGCFIHRSKLCHVDPKQLQRAPFLKKSSAFLEICITMIDNSSSFFTQKFSLALFKQGNEPEIFYLKKNNAISSLYDINSLKHVLMHTYA